MRKKNHASKLRAMIEEKESEDFRDKIKITAVKRLIWNEVVFEEDQEKLDALSKKITNAFRTDGVILYNNAIAVGKPFKRIGSFYTSLNHEETFKRLCNALSKISKESKYDFIVNYSRQEDYFEGGFGNFMQFGEVKFYPEIIIDGRMLLATSLDDIEVPLSYLTPYKDYLAPFIPKSDLITEVRAHSTDDSYWLKLTEEEFLNKGFVHFAQAEKAICLSMLDALKKYFQVDYTVDVIYGITNQDYNGVELPVKNMIAERF